MSEEKQKKILLAMCEEGQECIGVEVEKSPHLSRLALRLWRKAFGTGIQIATAPCADAAEKFGPYTLIGSEKEFIERVREMIEKEKDK